VILSGKATVRLTAKDACYTVEFVCYDGKQLTRNSSIKYQIYKIRNVSIVSSLTVAWGGGTL